MIIDSTEQIEFSTPLLTTLWKSQREHQFQLIVLDRTKLWYSTRLEVSTLKNAKDRYMR